MISLIKMVLMVAVAGAAAGAGYWWGTRHTTQAGPDMAAPQAAGKATDSRGKLLYYRNPMGLPDTSPTPKKDPMGMDYIPVYEREAETSSQGQITISTEKVQRLGVRTEIVTVRELGRTVRAVGTLQMDEARLSTVSPRFEGWIEKLLVGTTGQAVSRGQPLMEVYSPDLVTAQQEYLIAARGVQAVKDGGAESQANMRQLMESALARLRNWDVSTEEIQRLEREGTMRRSITLRAPVAGVVVEKRALAGMRFMPGEALYQISDLGSLWLIADVFEQDLGLIRQGQAAKISVNAYPGRAFTGKVSFIYPTVTPETRTAKVRIELASGGVLKPAMYASVALATGAPRKVIAVPDSAVIDSGVRRVVLVQTGEGRFEPREVKTGAQADDYVEVIGGVNAGERVVVSANFLLDSESNLKAALATFQSAPGDKGAKEASGTTGSVAHRAEGTLDAIDAKTGTVTVTHGPVATLKWPAMTMDFSLANRSLAANIKPGARFTMEFVERAAGDYVITKIEPSAPAKPAAGHAGH
jgi:Cu(I)/Ag(I) efflux system membrane fusion protein